MYDEVVGVSRAVDVRELVHGARCLPCQRQNRRCHIERGSTHCLQCVLPQACVFQRLRVSTATAPEFDWTELVSGRLLPPSAPEHTLLEAGTALDSPLLLSDAQALILSPPPFQAPNHGAPLFNASELLSTGVQTSNPESSVLPRLSFLDRPRLATSYRCPYGNCKKSTKSSSEMNKHIRWHVEPYGCTFEDCYSVFRSLNDLERHEDGQHFQPECWRCAQCFEIFFESDNFLYHLQNEHDLVEDGEVKQRLRKSRIGQMHQGSYWCGFCREIVVIKAKDILDVDQRFTHLSNHFQGAGEGEMARIIDDWLLPHGRKTKGQIRDEEGKQRGLEKEDEGNGSSNEVSKRSQSPPVSLPNVLQLSPQGTLHQSLGRPRNSAEPLEDIVATSYVERKTDKSRRCSLCWRLFTGKFAADHLRRHMRTVHEHRFSICVHCGMRLNRKDNLIQHIERRHPEASFGTSTGKLATSDVHGQTTEISLKSEQPAETAKDHPTGQATSRIPLDTERIASVNDGTSKNPSYDTFPDNTSSTFPPWNSIVASESAGSTRSKPISETFAVFDLENLNEVGPVSPKVPSAEKRNASKMIRLLGGQCPRCKKGKRKCDPSHRGHGE